MPPQPRTNKLKSFTLTPEAREHLDRIAERTKENHSELVRRLLRQEAEGLDDVKPAAVVKGEGEWNVVRRTASRGVVVLGTYRTRKIADGACKAINAGIPIYRPEDLII